MQKQASGSPSTNDPGSPLVGDQLTLSPAALRLAKAQETSSTATLVDGLLTGLMNMQSQASNPADLLKLLGTQGQPSLFDFLGDSSTVASSTGALAG